MHFCIQISKENYSTERKKIKDFSTDLAVKHFPINDQEITTLSPNGNKRATFGWFRSLKGKTIR